MPATCPPPWPYAYFAGAISVKVAKYMRISTDAVFYLDWRDIAVGEHYKTVAFALAFHEVVFVVVLFRFKQVARFLLTIAVEVVGSRNICAVAHFLCKCVFLIFGTFGKIFIGYKVALCRNLPFVTYLVEI